MLLVYMQSKHQMICLQDTESKKLNIATGYSKTGLLLYTNCAMREPKDVHLAQVKSEAQIFHEFLRFLDTKPDDVVFNVPRGKLDKLEKNKLKYFLDTKGDNKALFHDPLEQRGWRAFPFFVIDPYDRSTFPSLETNLRESSNETLTLKTLIKVTLRELEEHL